MRGSALSISILLSVLFAVALLYATLEIPMVTHKLLLEFFPDYWWPPSGVIESLRPFGYISFAITLILMITGFVTKWLKLATLGSIVMFLPTFGYFASTMLFLAGIGVLRALWFPLLDLSPKILRLGDVVYLPYIFLSFLVAPTAWVIGGSPADMTIPLSLMIMMLGIAVFLLGTVTWFYGKFTGLNVIDFWIYRHSRHPQYLGFLLWSYGLFSLATLFGAPKGGYVPPPSLPWLISALTIIGVALHEENIMAKKHGEDYVRYRNNTSFMLPLPKQLSALIMAPARALLKKNRPENGKEVALITIVYGILLVLLSLPSILFL